MTAVLAILPIFGLILLGYILGRRQWIAVEQLEGLRQVTFKVFMPCLLFSGIARASLSEALSPWLIAAYFLPAMLVFAGLNLWTYRRAGTPTVFGLAGAYSNNILVGLPVVTALFGHSGMVFVFAILAFHNVITFTAHSLFLSLFDPERRGFSPRTMLKTLANPLVIGMALGGVVNVLALPLPDTLWTMLDWLSRAALPCALIFLGAGLTRYRFRPSMDVWGVCATKLLVFPTLVALVTSVLPGLGDTARQVLILLAAGPIGVNVLAFVAPGDQQRDLGACIFLSTIGAALTLPIWGLWLHG
ncbi:AEC family transporter [Larsenimonas salina]|uniref:AEC family transporter n=1 Tax=Larsenimonas salina TaxID=1295565 RepID=UPI0020746926|nr:AEC family transporter [Larsenimonas salina]MCM5705692.1 AEC family transporter [Larsenimonas salina]